MLCLREPNDTYGRPRACARAPSPGKGRVHPGAPLNLCEFLDIKATTNADFEALPTPTCLEHLLLEFSVCLGFRVRVRVRVTDSVDQYSREIERGNRSISE